MRYVVLAVIEDDEGGILVNHVATCVKREDAEHFATLVEQAGVIEVGDEEWVNPNYAEIAQEGT